MDASKRAAQFMCEVCRKGADDESLPLGARCTCPTPQQIAEDVRTRWNARLSLTPDATKDLTVNELGDVAWLLDEVDRCHEGWSDETAEADLLHAERQAMTRVVEFVKHTHQYCFSDRCELCGLLAHVKSVCDHTKESTANG